MTNLKKIFALVFVAFILATISVPAFAEETATTEETAIESTVEESTKSETETTEKDNVTIIREDVTLVTEPESTDANIEISKEEISVETPSDADISIEYAPIDEEIPLTGSNSNVVTVVAAISTLALSALAILIYDKKKTA